MNGQLWSWVLSFIGILGFYLAGKKIWWAWYVNIGNQVFWLVYSLVTQQYGFLVATAFYTAVFSRNAYEWTKEHRAKPKVFDAIIDRFNIDRQDEVGLSSDETLTQYGQQLMAEITKKAKLIPRRDDKGRFMKKEDV